MDTFYYDDNDNIRVGNIEIFLEVAVDNYLQCQKYNDEITKLYPSSKEEKIDNLDHLFFTINEKRKHEIQGVISLCIFFEAVINEVGVVKLGSKYFKENVDTSNLMAKWKNVPRLAYNSGLDDSKAYFENLKKLISGRNKLVHYKTKVRTEDKINNEDELFDVLKKNLFTLREMLKDLRSLNTEFEYDYEEFSAQLNRIKIK
jgi:hypothetical protein